MIRVVLDTNVIVSAHLNEEGLEASLLTLALAGKIELCVSEAILAEYEGVLRRKKFSLSPRRITHSLSRIRKASLLVQPSRALYVATDPDDNRFLECVEVAQADYLVTGNRRHFPNVWGRAKVVTARHFLEIITSDLKQ